MNHTEIMKLKSISNAQLLTETDALVREERNLGLQIIHRLREISKRRLFAELGFSSMFTYCVEALKYHESTAFRLINAMKLLSEVPEVEEKVDLGLLSVSTLAQVQ